MKLALSLGSLSDRQAKGLAALRREKDDALFDNAPAIPRDLQLFYNAFWRLREATAFDQPINIRDTLALAEAYQFAAVERELLLDLVSAMDKAYSKWRSEKQAAEERRAKAKRKR